MASEKRARYHWLVAACCCALTAVSFGISLNCAGIFFAPVAEELKTGRGDIALYITLMNLVTGFSSPLAGRLVKRIPLRAWFLCAAVLVAGAMALWTRVTAVWQLYVLAAAQGIGNVMIGSVVVRMILKAWFASRLGLVLGIAFGFSGVAGAVLSPLLQAIVDCAGWRAAHDLSALLCALLILPGAFLLRRDPREKGLRPYYAGKAEAGKPPENVPLPVLPERNAGVPGIAALLAIGFIGPFLTGINQHMSGYATFIGLAASDGALMMTAIQAAVRHAQRPEGREDNVPGFYGGDGRRNRGPVPVFYGPAAAGGVLPDRLYLFPGYAGGRAAGARAVSRGKRGPVLCLEPGGREYRQFPVRGGHRIRV